MKRGARPGVPQREAPDSWRCQRVIVLRTGGKADLWRCGRRVREQGGSCALHRDVADARLV
jgi:hypothetical protein